MLVGCEVESTSKGDQGVKLRDGDEEEDAGGKPTEEGDPATGSDAGLAPEADAAAEADAASEGQAAAVRGFVVMHNEYMNGSSVTVLDIDGTVLSEQLISSGSTGAGASMALSADAVFPSNTAQGDEIVIVDRGNNVLTWVGLESAEVTQQVNIGPGDFAANPHDYVQVSDTKAFVTRYGVNPAGGEVDFDRGDDLLVLNPKTGKLTGAVSFAKALGDDKDDFEAHPDSVALIEGTLYVALATAVPNFGGYGTPRVVSVDPETEEVTNTVTLQNFSNCGEFAVSPDQKRLALACWGPWNPDDITAEAGIVLIDVSGDAPEVEHVFTAGDDLGVQPNALTFASNDSLLFTSYGNFDAALNDALYSLSLAEGDDFGAVSEPLLETSAFNLAEVVCAAAEKVCVLADAETEGGVIQYITLDAGGQVDKIKAISVAGAMGLKPRYVGTF